MPSFVCPFCSLLLSTLSPLPAPACILGCREIGVSYPDSTFGNMSREGTPFTYLLRDILQFDATLNDSIHRITTANRTCDLILGVGDGKADYKDFRGFEYSYSVADVFDDQDMRQG
jgi:isopenicillin-N N-acyltransferase like protein